MKKLCLKLCAVSISICFVFVLDCFCPDFLTLKLIAYKLINIIFLNIIEFIISQFLTLANISQDKITQS